MLAKRVARNVLYNSSSIIVSNAAGLLISVYLARTLQKELFGVYSLTISVAFLLMVFTDLGINATTVRFCARAFSKGDYEELRGFFKFLTKIKITLSIFSSLLLFLLSDFLSQNVFREEALSLPLKFASILILFLPLSGYLTSVFNAFNDFKANFVRAVSYEFSRVIAVISLVTLGLSVIGAILGYVVASITATVTLLSLLVKKYGRILFGKEKKIKKRGVLKFTSYLTIGSITWTIFAYVDSVMIGIFMPVEYVGYYRIALLVVSAISGILSVPAVMFPVFVALEGEDLRTAFKRAFKYSSMIAVPVAFGLPVIAKPVIRVAFGAEYLPAVTALWILSLLILRAALGFWGNIFNAKGMPEYPVYVLSLAMVMNVLLNYLLIPIFGISGAALATVASNALNWIALALLSKRIFNVFFDAWDLIKPVISSLVMLGVILNIKPKTIPEGILMIFVGAAVYFLVLWLLRGVSRKDIDYLWNAFK